MWTLILQLVYKLLQAVDLGAPVVVVWLHTDTCSEHARVRVCGGETQVLLDATAWAFGDFLEGKILWLLYHLPASAALLIHSLHSAV